MFPILETWVAYLACHADVRTLQKPEFLQWMMRVSDDLVNCRGEFEFFREWEAKGRPETL